MAKPRQKYIFVLGGVISGVGKGATTSSIAAILKSRGFKVNPIKIDPYLNVDAGTMNPIEHGEVFVLDSGLETDQDMGNYERFLDQTLPAESYMTSGMVYKYVIDKERALGYAGKCVDPLPYVSAEILRRIQKSVDKTGSEITIVEIGGTVGEYQNAIFIEAARILKLKHPEDVVFVLVSYLPVPGKLGEMKTKPTQYAVRSMNSYGVHPDIIVARAEFPIDKSRKEKLAFSSNIPVERIISAPDISSIYEIPLNFEKDSLSDTILKLLKLKARHKDLKEWRAMFEKMQTAKEVVNVAIVGKYFKTGDFVLKDVYISVIESLKHAGGALGKNVNIDWLDSEDYEGVAGKKKLAQLKAYDGVLVPGGFGSRGIEGKINVIQFVRENKIPYFGLCYGMQLAVIEYARHKAGLVGANTTEIDKEAKHKVIDIMEDQKQKVKDGNFGASMRLGSYPAHLKGGTVAREAYKKTEISERHRHRFEVNPEYIAKIEEAGLIFSGTSPDRRLMEIAELPKEVHPFFVGVQFHPELKSSPLNPHPLFTAFIKASVVRRRESKK